MWFEFWNDWKLIVRNIIVCWNPLFSQRNWQTLHLDSWWSWARFPITLIFFWTFFLPPYQVSTQCLSSSKWLTRGGRRRRCVHFCAMHSQCLPKTVKFRSLIPFLVSCRALLCRVFVCDVCCTSLARRSHYGRVLQCMQSVTSVFPESLPGPELLICLVPCATCSVLRNTLDVHVGSLRSEGLVIILSFEGLLAQNGLGASLFLVLVLVGSADTLLTLPGRRNAYEWCAVIGWSTESRRNGTPAMDLGYEYVAWCMLV